MCFSKSRPDLCKQDSSDILGFIRYDSVLNGFSPPVSSHWLNQKKLIIKTLKKSGDTLF